MKKYYDKLNKRLLFFKEEATPNFWDKHWNRYNFKFTIKKNEHNDFILSHTRRYLKNGKILEGGCGIGGNVYCLHCHGYSTYGVDFAKKTVEKINKYFPELNVKVGDVRNLEFSDEFFDGYWSLGVIEHFYEGYQDIIKEMKRVLKKEGYLFLSFPYMSPLRKFKTKLGLYRGIDADDVDLNRFYQFAFDSKQIQDEFEKVGFLLKYSEPFDGIKGFKDEVFIFKPLLQKLYDYRGKNRIIQKLKYLINRILEKSSSHMDLMVFQKRNTAKEVL